MAGRLLSFLMCAGASRLKIQATPSSSAEIADCREPSSLMPLVSSAGFQTPVKAAIAACVSLDPTLAASTSSFFARKMKAAPSRDGVLSSCMSDAGTVPRGSCVRIRVIRRHQELPLFADCDDGGAFNHATRQRSSRPPCRRTVRVSSVVAMAVPQGTAAAMASLALHGDGRLFVTRRATTRHETSILYSARRTTRRLMAGAVPIPVRCGAGSNRRRLFLLAPSPFN
jgi:hypothetical protein